MPEATAYNENANDVVQSRELELSYGLTNWWLVQFTTGSEQPLGESLRVSDVEFESEFVLIKREGDGKADMSRRLGMEAIQTKLGLVQLSRWRAENSY